MARGRPNAVEHEGRGHVYERELRAVFDDDGRCSLIATRTAPAGDELLLDYCFDTEVSCRRRRGATTSSVRTASRVSVWRVSRGGRLRRGELI